jgi:hypothetical protein
MNPGAFPLDVLETHLYDVTSPKPQAGEQKKYGPISFANRRAQITGGNETLYIFRRQVSR